MNYMDARYEIDRELLPEPGDRRVARPSRTRSTGCGGSSSTTRTSSATSPGPAGTTSARPASAGSTVADDPTAGQFGAPYPWLLAHVGDIDITGHRRPASYYREIVFGLRSDPYIAVLRPELHGRELSATPWAWTDTVGSWSWTGAEGKPVTVEVYSDADEVELLLDGALAGRRAGGGEEPLPGGVRGHLRAGRADRGGAHRRRGDRAVHAAVGDRAGRAGRSPPTGPRSGPTTPTSPTSPSRSQDADGTVALGVDREVTVTRRGAGRARRASAARAPATEESYLDDVHTTFDGRALAVVRPTGSGTITVTATAAGCDPVTVTVDAR